MYASKEVNKTRETLTTIIYIVFYFDSKGYPLHTLTKVQTILSPQTATAPLPSTCALKHLQRSLFLNIHHEPRYNGIYYLKRIYQYGKVGVQLSCRTTQP